MGYHALLHVEGNVALSSPGRCLRRPIGRLCCLFFDPDSRPPQPALSALIGLTAPPAVFPASLLCPPILFKHIPSWELGLAPLLVSLLLWVLSLARLLCVALAHGPSLDSAAWDAPCLGGAVPCFSLPSCLSGSVGRSTSDVFQERGSINTLLPS